MDYTESEYGEFAHEHSEYDSETIKQKGWGNRSGRGKDVLIKVTRDMLCDIFKISKMTLYRWTKEKKIDPTDLESVLQHLIKHRS